MKKKSRKQEKMERIGAEIPEDVIFDILAWLPVKSLARFRCVSKRWSSMISSQSFINAHINRSSSRPNLLIAFPSPDHRAQLIFSSPLPPHEETHQESPAAVATYKMFMPGASSSFVSRSLVGLICLRVGGRLRICNPSTRQFVTLPEPESPQGSPPDPDHDLGLRIWSFGYDPINNEHKALDIAVYEDPESGETVVTEHRIFDRGTYSWRRIENGPPYYPISDGISINGTLFYTSYTSLTSIDSSYAVAFDIRLETFRLIKLPFGDEFIFGDVLLIDYDGRLGIVHYEHLLSDNRMEVWILEDLEKGSWSRRSMVCPPTWRDIVGNGEYYLAGTIYTGELIVAPRSLPKPFYVYYYDLKKNSIRKVEIQGLPDYGIRFDDVFENRHNRITFSNHVESTMSLAEWIK